jgi:hypothetical protein
MDVRLFRRSLLIPAEFGNGTSSVGNFISLPFKRVQEWPNWMSYATWESVLMWTTLGRVNFGYWTCFRNSGQIPFYLDLGLVSLEGLSHPLSIHMYNIQIWFHTHPIRQFEAEVVLDSELDLKSNSGILIWDWISTLIALLFASPMLSWCPIHPPPHLHGS